MILNTIKKNIANILTISRLIATIFLIILYSKIDNKLYLKLMFTLIAITDFLDGYIARKFNQESKIGEILDPIADKVLIISMLILINIKLNNYIVIIPTVIIIIREILILYLRKKALQKYKIYIKVNKIGKIKTVLQIFGIFLLINNYYNLNNIENIAGIILIYVSIIPLIISLYIYVKKFISLDRK